MAIDSFDKDICFYEKDLLDKPKTKECLYCGTEFVPGMHNAKFCSRYCCNTYNKQRRKELKQEKIKKKNDLDIFLKKLDEYNKKHGTHLSYGEFKALSGTNV